MNPIIPTLPVILKVEVALKLEFNCSGRWELDFPETRSVRLIVLHFDSTRKTGESFTTLSFAVRVIWIVHADRIVQEETILTILAQIDTTVLALSFLDLVPVFF